MFVALVGLSVYLSQYKNRYQRYPSKMLRDSYAGTWNKETVVNKSPANNEITVNMREQMFDEVKKIMKENQEQNKKEMQEFKSDMMTMFKTMIETLLDKDEEGNKEKKMISVMKNLCEEKTNKKNTQKPIPTLLDEENNQPEKNITTLEQLEKEKELMQQELQVKINQIQDLKEAQKINERKTLENTEINENRRSGYTSTSYQLSPLTPQTDLNINQLGQLSSPQVNAVREGDRLINEYIFEASPLRLPSFSDGHTPQRRAQREMMLFSPNRNLGNSSPWLLRP